METIEVTFTVNGNQTQVVSRVERTLLDVLREDLGLTGVKNSCGGEGECGSCTVIMDGSAVNACLVPVGQLEGCRVLTIEGLGTDDGLHPLQDAFLQVGAVQCGYCTPGAILSAKALLDKDPEPSEEAIREALSGNLCRCTGYVKMVDAVTIAAEVMRNE